MEKPKNVRSGKPFCNSQMLYLIYQNGGSMKRGELRAALDNAGYSKYCIYEAFRRCEWKQEIWFEGSGHSNNQIVHLSDKLMND